MDEAIAKLQTFRQLCVELDALDATSSRKRLTQLLTGIFDRVPPDSIAQVIYLIQGRVAPVYEPIELGMADRSVEGTIAEAFGVSREGVAERYRTLGDLGDVAYALAAERESVASPDVSISEVYATLRKIAETAGAGTQGTRTQLLSGLLARLDPLSARFLVRMVVGRLRLGVGDPTILDALAAMQTHSREAKEILKGAYNRTSDLGEIARVLRTGGLDAVAAMRIQAGHPVRPELAERLPGPEAVIDRLGTVVVQDKYDGIRVQIHKDGDRVRLFSRNLEDLTDMFPEIVAGTRRQVPAQSVILDSEAVVYQSLSQEFLPFQVTAQRRRKYGIEEMSRTLPVSAFVFDILYREGEPLTDRPLTERLQILGETVRSGEALIVSESTTVDDAVTLTADFEEAITHGLEGLVVKRPESRYEAGARNLNWVKLKRHSAGALQDTVDCVILGLFAGRGKRAALGAGALLVGVYDAERDEFETVTRIGTGLTDEEWREIARRTRPLQVDHRPARVWSLTEPTVWVEPEIVVEVLADEITRSPVHTAGKRGDEPGYALRFPRLISFRGTDKRPEDATTVRELLEMYRQQEQMRQQA